jgi:hypothetical protein
MELGRMCRHGFSLNPPACPAAHAHTHRDRQPEAEGLSINRPMLICLAGTAGRSPLRLTTLARTCIASSYLQVD